MDTIWQELTLDFANTEQTLRVCVRLIVALLLGAVIGWERERRGKPAGLRTHMLVSLGSALFVLAPSVSGLQLADLSRVIQGVATGVGFIGAGSILKLNDEREIRWLTTAAGLWVTSAVGVAAGLGHIGSAVICVILGWIVLAVCDIGDTNYQKDDHGKGGSDARPNPRTGADSNEQQENQAGETTSPGS